MRPYAQQSAKRIGEVRGVHMLVQIKLQVQIENTREDAPARRVET